jgi:hypothetical protein
MPSTSRPLGLLDSFEVNAEDLRRLRFLDQYDLSEVMDQYVAWCRKVEPRPSSAKGRPSLSRLELELKRFFALPVLFRRRRFNFVPGLPIDLLWHVFILNTKLYSRFCNRVYGQYLEHVPGKSRPEASPTARTAPLNYTLTCIRRAFGEYEPSLWECAADCIPCDHGSVWFKGHFRG